jgi:hypothetical protein
MSNDVTATVALLMGMERREEPGDVWSLRARDHQRRTGVGGDRSADPVSPSLVSPSNVAHLLELRLGESRNGGHVTFRMAGQFSNPVQ